MAVPEITTRNKLGHKSRININGTITGPLVNYWDADVIIAWLRESWPDLVTATIANANPAPAKKPRKGAKKK